MSFAVPEAAAAGRNDTNPFNGSDASDDEASVDSKMPAPSVFGGSGDGMGGGVPAAAAAAAAAQAAAAGLGIIVGASSA